MDWNARKQALKKETAPPVKDVAVFSRSPAAQETVRPGATRNLLG